MARARAEQVLLLSPLRSPSSPAKRTGRLPSPYPRETHEEWRSSESYGGCCTAVADSSNRFQSRGCVPGPRADDRIRVPSDNEIVAQRKKITALGVARGARQIEIQIQEKACMLHEA
ncbi:hypothetical protein B0H14DRAFT_2617227 [Mycena olivaceomarginata]|nr:hypothetical protein B0H14DRAFT_2617227 [Mycena olivaceomarginata]